jgi:hypothetical protein
MIVLLCILFLVFGAITMIAAEAKGYPPVGFFLLGACFPLLGLIIALCLPPVRRVS